MPRHNTTSVYTAAQIFPMLPEKLSTDLTSLNPDEERLAVVVEMVVGADGSVEGSDVYRARVRNQAKLAYNSVAAWLDGTGPSRRGDGGGAGPGREPAAAGPGRAEHEELPARARRAEPGDHRGASRCSRATVSGIEVEEKNRAKSIIEDFMIAANGVTARYPGRERALRPSGAWCARPKRWDRIVELAAEHGYAPAGRARLGGAGGVPDARRRPPIRCGSPTCRWR